MAQHWVHSNTHSCCRARAMSEQSSPSSLYLGGEPEAQRIHPRSPLVPPLSTSPSHLLTLHVCLLSPAWLEPSQTNLQNGKNYFWNIYLIRDLHLEYMKDSYNSIIKKTNNPLWNIKRIWIEISPEKIYRWPISTWKHAQYHLIITEKQIQNPGRYCLKPIRR